MKLILIRGNSASGKTTLAQRLQSRLEDCVLISKDQIRAHTTSGFVVDALKNAVRQAEGAQFLILEGVMPKNKYRELFHWLVGKFEIYAYYYDISLAETLRRHKTRSCCGSFGSPEMRVWYKAHDYLTGMIPETILTEQDTLEDAEARILYHLGYETSRSGGGD